MTPAERYAAAVVSQLERVPRSTRARLRGELAAEITEYPEAEDYAAIVSLLGTPAEYANELASNLGVTVGSRCRLRGWMWVPLAGVVAVAAWLMMAQLSNPVAPGSYFGGDGLDLDLSAQPFTQVTYEASGGGLFIWSLANTGRFPVEILELDVFPAVSQEARELFDQPGGINLIVQTGVEYEGMVDPPYFGAPLDAVPLSDGGAVIRPGNQLGLAISVVFDNCEMFEPDSDQYFQTALVTYSYLGLRQQVELEFPSVQVSLPASCTASGATG